MDAQKKMNVAVLASGRGSNLQALLDAEKRGEIPCAHIALVISDNPEAKALQRAQAAGVEAVFVDPTPFKKRRAEYDGEILKVLRSRHIEFLVLAGFMRILSDVLLNAYPNKIINIHPALLPAFPGLHGQRQALEYGAKVSGCTVHFVDAGVDTGPIILQAVVPVMDDDTEDTLSARILQYEHRTFPKALDLISRGLVRVEGRRVFIDEDPEQK